MNGIKYKVYASSGRLVYYIGIFEELRAAIIFAEALIHEHYDQTMKTGEPTKVVIEQKLPETDECKENEQNDTR